MSKMIHPLFPCHMEIHHRSLNKDSLHEEARISRNQATITISPLEPGLGHLLGNLLRRLLFRFSSGSAITSVWISGIQHELSTLRGVQEDIVDILQQISQIGVQMDHYGPGRIYLKKEGPATITTDDLIPSSGIRILSKSAYLFTLNTEGLAWMVFNVESGKGSFEGQNIRLQNHKKQFLDDSFNINFVKNVNKYQIDSLLGTVLSVPHQFGPVTKTAYEVRSFTHYDELIFDLETNGSMSALESFESAFSFFLQKFIQIQTESRSTI